MFKQLRQAISIVILVAFITTTVRSPAYAQVDPMPFMPKPGVMVQLSPEYTPAYLKGIVIHPENALKFDFIIDRGDKPLTDAQKRDEYTKLTKYFLASLAIPDDDQWVNLSPYEKDRIIRDNFGKTEMGRDLLAQDYMLKQITASLIYPEDSLGKKFWDKVYTEAQKQYGTTDIPVNTFNKVWILPDDALIYEKGNTAYILKNHLRVMLEEDYLSLQKHSGIQSAPINNNTHTIASKVVREIVLPELQREVNEDENFAAVRQVYSGMLLATWYKQALKKSLLNAIYTNKSKVRGVDQDPKTNEMIYRQYLKAYKKGVFNFIQDDVDKYTNETIPRKYFSGGEMGYRLSAAMLGHKIITFVRGMFPKSEQGAGKREDLVEVVADTPAPEVPNRLLASAMGLNELLKAPPVDVETRVGQMFSQGALSQGGYLTRAWTDDDRTALAAAVSGEFHQIEIPKVSVNNWNEPTDIVKSLLKLQMTKRIMNLSVVLGEARGSAQTLASTSKEKYATLRGEARQSAEQKLGIIRDALSELSGSYPLEANALLTFLKRYNADSLSVMSPETQRLVSSLLVVLYQAVEKTPDKNIPLPTKQAPAAAMTTPKQLLAGVTASIKLDRLAPSLKALGAVVSICGLGGCAAVQEKVGNTVFAIQHPWGNSWLNEIENRDGTEGSITSVASLAKGGHFTVQRVTVPTRIAEELERQGYLSFDGYHPPKLVGMTPQGLRDLVKGINVGVTTQGDQLKLGFDPVTGHRALTLPSGQVQHYLGRPISLGEARYLGYIFTNGVRTIGTDLHNGSISLIPAKIPDHKDIEVEGNTATMVYIYNDDSPHQVLNIGSQYYLVLQGNEKQAVGVLVVPTHIVHSNAMMAAESIRHLSVVLQEAIKDARANESSAATQKLNTMRSVLAQFSHAYPAEIGNAIGFLRGYTPDRLASMDAERQGIISGFFNTLAGAVESTSTANVTATAAMTTVPAGFRLQSISNVVVAPIILSLTVLALNVATASPVWTPGDNIRTLEDFQAAEEALQNTENAGNVNEHAHHYDAAADFFGKEAMGAGTAYTNGSTNLHIAPNTIIRDDKGNIERTVDLLGTFLEVRQHAKYKLLEVRLNRAIGTDREGSEAAAVLQAITELRQQKGNEAITDPQVLRNLKRLEESAVELIPTATTVPGTTNGSSTGPITSYEGFVAKHRELQSSIKRAEGVLTTNAALGYQALSMVEEEASKAAANMNASPVELGGQVTVTINGSPASWKDLSDVLLTEGKNARVAWNNFLVGKAMELEGRFSNSTTPEESKAIALEIKGFNLKDPKVSLGVDPNALHNLDELEKAANAAGSKAMTNRASEWLAGIGFALVVLGIPIGMTIFYNPEQAKDAFSESPITAAAVTHETAPGSNVYDTTVYGVAKSMTNIGSYDFEKTFERVTFLDTNGNTHVVTRRGGEEWTQVVNGKTILMKRFDPYHPITKTIVPSHGNAVNIMSALEEVTFKNTATHEEQVFTRGGSHPDNRWYTKDKKGNEIRMKAEFNANDPEQAANWPLHAESRAMHTAIPVQLRSSLVARASNNGTDVGGIDFNAANLTLRIKRDGNGVPLPLSQQDMASLSNLQGLEPVIMNIRPASSLPFFSQLPNNPVPASN